ncbi:MAG: TetR/AcrR family transcriptional regulator [Alphaproteobacteria bacterium]|nr:TetR/AcrR family transcriptional regulator [Alphaproteobacteria bacterium]
MSTPDTLEERPVSTPESRRERKKQENRAQLLAAARAVFAEMGFGAASVRDIVRRTDLATGTFYNYFEDKDAIFAAVVGELTDELVRRHRAGRAVADTPEAFLRAHFGVYFRFIADDPELLALARRNVTAIRTLLDQPDVRTLARCLYDDIKDAMARGALPATDAAMLAAALSGIAFEVSVMMIARDPVDADGAAEFATRLMLGGLKGMEIK